MEGQEKKIDCPEILAIKVNVLTLNRNFLWKDRIL